MSSEGRKKDYEDTKARVSLVSCRLVTSVIFTTVIHYSDGDDGDKPQSDQLVKLTSKRSDDTLRVAVTLLASGVVVEVFLAVVTFPAVEVGLAVALSLVVARRADRTGRVTVARWGTSSSRVSMDKNTYKSF